MLFYILTTQIKLYKLKFESVENFHNTWHDTIMRNQNCCMFYNQLVSHLYEKEKKFKKKGNDAVKHKRL